MYWPPMQEYKRNARRAAVNRGRAKFEYPCESCQNWFLEKEINIDHIEPLGSLRSLEDLAPFVAKLSAEEGYQILCKACHLEKSVAEKKSRAKI